MEKGVKFLAFLLVVTTVPLSQVSAQLDISTDGDYINTDGDTIELDYSGIKNNISDIKVLVDDETITYSEKPVENIELDYNGPFTGEENISIDYEINGGSETQNINKNLTKYSGSFKGFYDEDVKPENEITRQLYYRELDNVLIEADMSQTDGNNTWSPKGLLGRDFEVVSEEDNSSAEIKLEGRSRNPYRFSFDSIPNMEVGEKDFTLKMKNGPKIKEFTIQKRAAFEGKILTKSGPGTGEFKLVDESISEFQTDKNGYFFKLLESGKIDRTMQLDLGEVTTTFGDIDVKSGEQENIKYEFYRGLDPSEVKTEKLLEPKNLIAFSSNYPVDIEETSVTMNYNTSEINPSEVEVYECKYWDFYGEQCRTNWKEKKDIKNQELLGKVKIEKLKTEGGGEFGLKSAYMVAVPYERPSLQLKEDISLDKSEYNIEDSIIVEGNILNSKTGKAVEDAVVKLRIQKKGNDSVKSSFDEDEAKKTDENGFFTFPPLEIPDDPGNYSLTLEAEKQSYNNISTTYEDNIKASQRKEIELEGSDKEMKPGERTTSVLTLENTGQADIKNIKIKEENIKTDHYTLNPQNIDKLESGSSTTVTLMSILPNDYCEGGCKGDSFKVSIEGNADGEILSDTVSLNIPEPTDTSEDNTEKTENGTETKDKSNKSEKNEEKKNSSESSPLITGDFMKGETGMTLGLITLLILLTGLLVAVRKKNRDTNGNGKTRSTGLTNLVGEIRSQIKDLDFTGAENKDIENGYEQESRPKSSTFTNQRRRNISKPKVSASKQENRENNSEKNEGKDIAQILEENEEMVCPECREDFDTETAFRLHFNHHH